MKASQMLISTLKDAPQDAKIQSHILLIRAGFIKSIVAGVYNYLPLGLRTLKKIEKVIREELDNSGALEILSSAMQPKELWEESGRWSKYGKELFRFHDRHDRDFCLGPTHEEVFTNLAKNLIKSSKNLPLNLYQIQTKYRDEARPRFGLIRAREFIMKDAYSFDKDEEGLEASYKLMYDTYSRIFDRLGIKYKIVLADTGAIGGKGSHQFMALSEIGESDILYCDSCDYAADIETADAICTLKEDKQALLKLEEVSTPNVKTIEEVSKFLNVDKTKVCKSIVYKDTLNNKLVCAIVRGDREVNEIKLINKLGIAEAFFEMASFDDIKSINSVLGFVGPVGLNIDIYIDTEVSIMKNIIVGANKANAHLINVNYNKDFKANVLDLRKTVKGDSCPCCSKPLNIDRGIEVGQIFKLQQTYSKLMNCTYTNELGENIPLSMGCYGIGVSRTLASIVEQYSDEYGMKFPYDIAPYHVSIVPVKYEDPIQQELAIKIYNDLKAKNIEVILDDRNNGLGYKLKDWELIGIPYQVVIGKKANEGIVEFKNRDTLEKIEISANDVLNHINKK
ncbi:MAG: proline--tRNA ligase [Anaeroplasmataceae bacterium]